MEKDNIEPGFIRFRNDLFNVLLLLDLLPLDLTGRQIKVILLILRLSVGCNRVWARVKLSEFIVVGIDPTHIREVIDPLLEKEIILCNREERSFKVNIDYLLSEFHNIINFRKELLSFLIGLNIPKKTSQSSNTKIPNKEKKVLLDRKKVTSQNGNFGKQESASMKDTATDTFTNSDTNSKKNAIQIRNDPFSFIPNSNEEFVALETWKRLEPNKPESFKTYLYAITVVPVDLIGQWASEIEQDNTILNKGAVFVYKLKTYTGE